MLEQRHQTVSTAKFVEAMRTAGVGIGGEWSGLTIQVGLNATAVAWKEKGVPTQQPAVTFVEAVAEKPPSKQAKTKTNPRTKTTSEDKPQ